MKYSMELQQGQSISKVMGKSQARHIASHCCFFTEFSIKSDSLSENEPQTVELTTLSGINCQGSPFVNIKASLPIPTRKLLDRALLLLTSSP